MAKTMSSQLLAEKPIKLRSARIKKYPASRAILLDVGYFLYPVLSDAQADVLKEAELIDKGFFEERKGHSNKTAFEAVSCCAVQEEYCSPGDYLPLI